jgi:hypothetical protein
MNKKIILSVVLLCLVSMVFASAKMTLLSERDYEYEVEYEVEVNLREGWNLVAGAGDFEVISESSPIKKGDISVVYGYLPISKAYVMTVPYDNREVDKLHEEEKKGFNYKQMLSSSFWVYSKKSGTLIFKTEILPLNERKLYSGWNFISMTPEMSEKNLNQIKGTCNIEKFYMYVGEGEMGGWSGNLADFLKDRSKVSSDCKMRSGSSDITPPSIPDGTEGTEMGKCVDSDSGINYLEKGNVKGIYVDHLTNREREEEAEDLCINDESFSQTDINYYLEREYISEDQIGDENILLEFGCNGDYIIIHNYECPNGCLNGACI